MANKVKCIVCHKSFRPWGVRNKTCGMECQKIRRLEFRRAQRRRHYAKHRDQIIEAVRMREKRMSPQQRKKYKLDKLLRYRKWRTKQKSIVNAFLKAERLALTLTTGGML